MELVKLKSIYSRTFFSRGIEVKPGDKFEDTPSAAKDLIGRKLAAEIKEEVEKKPEKKNK